MTDIFDDAFEFLMHHEGGYSNDPADPGGETRYGISKRSYPNLDISKLTLAEAKEIYRLDWWEAHGFSRIAKNRQLAIKLFDLAVNMGIRPAVMILQRALVTAGVTVTIDGAFGPATVSAVNDFQKDKVDVLMSLVKFYAMKRYIDLGMPKFLAGWIRRATA